KLQQLYNGPRKLELKPDGVIVANVVENKKDGRDNISYHISKDYRVTNVQFDDEFEESWEALADEGKLPQLEGLTYAAQLRDAVTYWTDSGWVTEGELRALENPSE
ncbi:MAG: hypothetical protein KAT58_10080, partial [candidate division Zixibacteria bacterium]|nr:hypothetical protein [candidate division Zixibacteria bacterium]